MPSQYPLVEAIPYYPPAERVGGDWSAYRVAQPQALNYAQAYPGAPAWQA